MRMILKVSNKPTVNAKRSKTGKRRAKNAAREPKRHVNWRR